MNQRLRLKLGSTMNNYFARLESNMICLKSITTFINVMILQRTPSSRMNSIFFCQIFYINNIMKNKNKVSRIHHYDTKYESLKENEDWYETYII